MKKIIIVLQVLTSCLYGQVTETIVDPKTILLPEDYQEGIPEYFIPAGTVVKIEAGYRNPGVDIISSRTSFFLNTNTYQVTNLSQINSVNTNIYSLFDKYHHDWISYYAPNPKIYSGPIYLRLFPPRSDSEANKNLRFTISIERQGVPLGTTNNFNASPSTAVVIPSAVAGDVDIILEQSQDGVTWTQCLPGTYNSSTVKRFFRLRAVEK